MIPWDTLSEFFKENLKDVHGVADFENSKPSPSTVITFCRMNSYQFLKNLYLCSLMKTAQIL